MPAEHGVIYTKRWVVDFVLDLAGYVSGSGITNKVIVEPSCGCGAFMVSIVERLADEATRRGTSWEDLADAVHGYDIDIASIDVTKTCCSRRTHSEGVSRWHGNTTCQYVVNSWGLYPERSAHLRFYCREPTVCACD